MDTNPSSNSKKKEKIDPDFTDTPYLEILNKKVARKVFISK